MQYAIKVTDLNYNTEFICTYKSFGTAYYCNLCYQIQLLQALNMMHYDDYLMKHKIDKLYIFLRENPEVKKILENLSKKHQHLEFLRNITQDLEHMFCFQLLFSYDYFETFHKCLSQYLNYLYSHTDRVDNNTYFNYFKELEEFILRD